MKIESSSPYSPCGPALLRTAFFLLLTGLATAAHAHSDHGDASGFLSGYLHPLSGIDHLLAMVAVGIWGATLGRPLIWALPVAFPLMMVIGGVVGISGVPLPGVEIGIATSVLALGVAIALAWRAPLVAALAIVAVFGVLHGYAHGLELPEATSPQAYAAGFVVSTGMLHLAGIALGLLSGVQLQGRPVGAMALRAGGGLIAMTGVWLLIGLQGA